MNADDGAIIDGLYAAVAEPRRWESALAAIAGRFHAAGAALVYLDGAAPVANLGLCAGIWNAAAVERYAEFAIHDPAPAAFAREPRGAATTTTRLFTPGQLRTSLFYNEFFRPIGLLECAGGLIFSDHGRFSILGIHRAKDRRPFTDGELRSIGALMPHIRRSLQLRNAFMRARLEASALAAAADRLPLGMAIIAQLPSALHVNAALTAMVARGDGLKLDARRWLRAEERAADRRLCELQAAVLGAGGAGGTVRVGRASGRPYAVLIAPLPPGTGFADAAGDAAGAIGAALVLVHDPAAATPELPELLMQAFGLTPGAARLAAALAAGHDLKSYAEREGLTLHTVRFHLKTAFARMEVRTQSALVRAVVRLMADLALGPPRIAPSARRA